MCGGPLLGSKPWLKVARAVLACGHKPLAMPLAMGLATGAAVVWALSHVFNGPGRPPTWACGHWPGHCGGVSGLPVATSGSWFIWVFTRLNALVAWHAKVAGRHHLRT